MKDAGNEFYAVVEFVREHPAVFCTQLRYAVEKFCDARGPDSGIITMNDWMRVLNSTKSESEKYVVAGGSA